MATIKIQDQLRALAFLEDRFSGIKFILEDLRIPKNRLEVYWGGGKIPLYVDGAWRSFRDIVHELAHWLVAPKRRKNKPNFGLGVNTFTAGEHDKSQIVSDKLCTEEEARASALGIHLLWQMGFKQDARYDFRDHAWETVGGWYKFRSSLNSAISSMPPRFTNKVNIGKSECFFNRSFY